MPLAIFDLDNTLIDREAAYRRWAEAFAAGRGLGPDEVAWLIETDGDGFAPRPALAAAIRDRYGLDEPVERVLERIRAAVVAGIDPDPTAAAVLERLRDNGWRVAIATNGNTDQHWAKIRRVGLDRLVDAVAVSQEVGANKPDRRVFEAAAQRCGARLADGGWMVGDCATRDIGGAQAVGLRTVWLRRCRDWDPAAVPPDGIVDHVAEAEPLLVP
jgi:putative hydrolase of the HAD superfamily